MTITDTAAAGTLRTAHRTGHEAPAWRPFQVAVARLHRLSPAFLRITFTGDDLDQFAHDGPDQRLKVHIPPQDHRVPDPGPTGGYARHRAWDPDARGFVRTYTIRAVRHERRELDVDFVLHADASGHPAGPAAAWAARASVGDELVVVGPNRLFAGERRGHEWNPPLDVRDILIAGDETAVPAIAGVLERLRLANTPARIRVVLEVPRAADVLHLPAPGHAEITWLPRDTADGSAAPHGRLLVHAVRSMPFDACSVADTDLGPVTDTVDIDRDVLWEIATGAIGPMYAWVAGEAGAVKAIRRHLVNDRGIDKRAVTFMGYWRLGRALDD